MPGPGNYDAESKLLGKNLVSKFKSAVLGGSLMNKTKRFTLSQSINYFTQQKLPQFGTTKKTIT